MELVSDEDHNEDYCPLCNSTNLVEYYPEMVSYMTDPPDLVCGDCYGKGIAEIIEDR